MEARKILTILVLALGLMVCLAQVSEAVPMGTTITYQGRLIDANSTADGLYDFEFKLYDVNTAGIPVANDVNVADVDVIDGFFTVELDFDGSAFNGDARWLEIGVRPGEMNDPNVYTTLSPRQEVTATPYALYAKNAQTAGSDNDWMISGNDMYSIPSGNVGIGTASPDAKLTVVNTDVWGTAVYGEASDSSWTSNYGGFFRTKGKNGYGVYGEASDSGTGINHGGFFEARGSSGRGVEGIASGSSGVAVFGHASASSGTNYGIWGMTSSSAGYAGYFEGGKNYFEGNVGIGTTNPDFKLDIASGALRLQSESGPRGLYFYSDEEHRIWVDRPNNTMHLTEYGDIHFEPGPGQTTKVIMKGSGNVGIGTTSPGAKLHVAGGDILLDNKKSLKAKDAGGTPRSVLWMNSSDNVTLGNWAGGDIRFGTLVPPSSILWTRLHVKSNGRVSVGETWPSYSFQVAGDIAYTGSIYDISDLRLKENITPLENALEKVSCLRGIYFNNKDESPDKREVGVIAQDVETVLPELVSTGDRGYKWVDYTQLTAVLVEAVKELKSENQALKQRIEVLETSMRPNQAAEAKEVQL